MYAQYNLNSEACKLQHISATKQPDVSVRTM
uniref:Uncharacterized protein n=1 Tax=Arundo donax TaxID=35708 RepID=A0A0A9BNG4_ARUDO